MIQMNLLAATADRDLASRYQERVLAYLEQSKSWKLRRDICQAFPGLTDRALREIASNSKGRILSGQSGYILIEYATNEEIDRAEAWLLSQSREMLKRVLAIRKARNRGVAA